jgi:non-heme chloroperoxidase
MSTTLSGLSSLLPAESILPAGQGHQVPTGDGTRLHAIVAGAGTPLVLTHGALLSLEAWALLWRPLLAAGHQLIAYDLRGHGHSTLGRSGFGVRAYAQDLAAVLDHFDLRQGVVVAHSTGGIGALALAVGAPTSAHAPLAGQVLISTRPRASATARRTGCWPDRVLRADPPAAAPAPARHPVHPRAVRRPS